MTLLELTNNRRLQRIIPQTILMKNKDKNILYTNTSELMGNSKSLEHSHADKQALIVFLQVKNIKQYAFMQTTQIIFSNTLI